MFQFLALITAILLLAYSTAGSLFGIISAQWWTGPNGANIGIWANCSNNFTIDGSDLTEFCYDIDFNKISNSTEAVMSYLLIGAVVIGGLCIISLFFDLLCSVLCICCGGTTVSILTSVFVLGQGALIAAVCFMMAIYYNWSYPAGMDSLGPAYYINIFAVVACVLACILINVDRMKCASGRKNKKSKKGGNYA